MIYRTFTTLANKLKHDAYIINYYKNIFVSHDTLNKYMVLSAGMVCAGYMITKEEIRELKTDIKDVKQDIKELRDIIISKK